MLQANPEGRHKTPSAPENFRGLAVKQKKACSSGVKNLTAGAGAICGAYFETVCIQDMRAVTENLDQGLLLHTKIADEFAVTNVRAATSARSALNSACARQSRIRHI